VLKLLGFGSDSLRTLVFDGSPQDNRTLERISLVRNSCALMEGQFARSMVFYVVAAFAHHSVSGSNGIRAIILAAGGLRAGAHGLGGEFLLDYQGAGEYLRICYN